LPRLIQRSQRVKALAFLFVTPVSSRAAVCNARIFRAFLGHRETFIQRSRVAPSVMVAPYETVSEALQANKIPITRKSI